MWKLWKSDTLYSGFVLLCIVVVYLFSHNIFVKSEFTFSHFRSVKHESLQIYSGLSQACILECTYFLISQVHMGTSQLQKKKKTFLFLNKIFRYFVVCYNLGSKATASYSFALQYFFWKNYYFSTLWEFYSRQNKVTHLALVFRWPPVMLKQVNIVFLRIRFILFPVELGTRVPCWEIVCHLQDCCQAKEGVGQMEAKTPSFSTVSKLPFSWISIDLIAVSLWLPSKFWHS